MDTFLEGKSANRAGLEDAPRVRTVLFVPPALVPTWLQGRSTRGFLAVREIGSEVWEWSPLECAGVEAIKPSVDPICDGCPVIRAD